MPRITVEEISQKEGHSERDHEPQRGAHGHIAHFIILHTIF